MFSSFPIIFALTRPQEEHVIIILFIILSL